MGLVDELWQQSYNISASPADGIYEALKSL